MHRHRWIVAALFLALAGPAVAADLPKVTQVELQPLGAQAQRIKDALDFVGAPLSDADKNALQTAAADTNAARGVEQIQTILDKYCLAGVRITPAGGSKPEIPILEVLPGPA